MAWLMKRLTFYIYIYMSFTLLHGKANRLEKDVGKMSGAKTTQYVFERSHGEVACNITP